MADRIIQMKSLDKEDDFYPNVKDKNIPDKSINGNKLSDDLLLKNVTIEGTVTINGKDSLIMKDGSISGVGIALTSDIPIYYHHTVRLKNSAGASFCFTAESKKNTKADSLSAIFALFANTDICGWGYKSATEAYNCIHIGVSSADTTLANAVTGNTVSLADSGYDASVEDTVKEI